MGLVNSTVKWVRRIREGIFAPVLLIALFTESTRADIVLNQLGFLPHASKIAVLPNVEAGAFYLVDESNQTEMLRGPLTQPQRWDVAGQTVKVADFTAFNKPGTYRLRVAGLKDSKPFTIKEGIYQPLIEAVALSFYVHRSGAPLIKPYAGDFARPTLHSDLMVLVPPYSAGDRHQANTYGAFTKGWYNSNDTGKAVVANATALSGLLNAVSDYPKAVEQLGLSVPNTDPGVPAIGLEMLWAYEWLVSMQDSDGGVYHGVSAIAGQPNARVLMPKSTAATLHFAGVMAQWASTADSFPVLKPYQSQALKKAEQAWLWAQKNSKVIYVHPSQLTDEAYTSANESLADERLWAAVQLWMASGAKAQKKYTKHLKLPSDIRLGTWEHQEIWALLALAQYPKTSPPLRRSIEQLLNKTAHSISQQLWASGYMVPLVANDFMATSSNTVALTKAALLLKWNKIAPNKDYEPTARALLDYLLGRNPLNTSYVTGFGDRSPQQAITKIHPNKTPKGLLVSGPSRGLVEQCGYNASIAAKAYIDSTCTHTNTASVHRQGLLFYVLLGLRQAHL